MKMEVLGCGVTLGRLQEPTDSTLSCPLSRQAGWAAQADKVRETAEKNLAWLGLSCSIMFRLQGRLNHSSARPGSMAWQGSLVAPES